SSTIRRVAASPVMSGGRIAHDELRAATIGAVARGDGAALGLDEALGNAEAGAGAPAIARVGTVELVEQAIEGFRRDARPLVAHHDLDLAAGRPGSDLDATVGWRI